MDKNFEIFLANFSFLILFISMLMYWGQASNFETKSTKDNFSTKIFNNKKNLIPNPLTPITEGLEWVKGGKGLSIATISTIIANVALFLLLVLRWKESGHFPLSNLYESLMFLSWSLTLIHLIIELGLNSSFNQMDLKESKNELAIKQRKTFIATRLIGSITAPSALFTNAFATFSLPKEMQEAAPLVPALQSNWLMMHVTVMILSYAALILGSLLSIGFLVINNQEVASPAQGKGLSKEKFDWLALKGKQPPKPFFEVGKELSSESAIVPLRGDLEGVLQSAPINFQQGFDSLSPLNPSRGGLGVLEVAFPKAGLVSPIGVQSNFKTTYRSNLSKTLDNLSYRVLGIGFPLLTIGILSGAVWANEAWGSYWSWDPKETWALLTWFVFAIYLHTRLTKGWEGKKPALIASLGFVTVWICFLGVNLIGEGLHSYGWIGQS